MKNYQDMSSRSLKKLINKKVIEFSNFVSDYLETELNKYPELLKNVNTQITPFKMNINDFNKEKNFTFSAYDKMSNLLESTIPSEYLDCREWNRNDEQYDGTRRIEIFSPHKKYTLTLEFNAYYVDIFITKEYLPYKFMFKRDIINKQANAQYTDELADVILNIYNNLENVIDEKEVIEIYNIQDALYDAQDRERDERRGGLVYGQKQQKKSSKSSKKRGKYLSVIEFTYEPMMVLDADDGEPTKEDVENLDGDCYVYIDELRGYAEAFFQSSSDLDNLLIENDPQKVYGIWGPFNAKEVSKIKSKGVWNEDDLPECDYEPEYNEDEDYDDGGW